MPADVEAKPDGAGDRVDQADAHSAALQPAPLLDVDLEEARDVRAEPRRDPAGVQALLARRVAERHPGRVAQLDARVLVEQARGEGAADCRLAEARPFFASEGDHAHAVLHAIAHLAGDLEPADHADRPVVVAALDDAVQMRADQEVRRARPVRDDCVARGVDLGVGAVLPRPAREQLVRLALLGTVGQSADAAFALRPDSRELLEPPAHALHHGLVAAGVLLGDARPSAAIARALQLGSQLALFEQ